MLKELDNISLRVKGRINRALGYPSLILYQAAGACNLKCSHCFYTLFGKDIPDGQAKILSTEEFVKGCERIKPFIKKARFFQFSTLEALVHNRLTELMDTVLRINPSLRFPLLSNSMAVSEDVLMRLRSYPISEFSISMDGLDQKTVEITKTGVSLVKIIEAIKAIVNIMPDVPLSSVIVLHRKNYRQLPEYVDYVKELGVNNIYVDNLLCFTRKFQSLALYEGDRPRDLDDIFKQTKKRVLANRQTIWLPKLEPDLSGCEQFQSLFINHNGDVSPCDYLSVSTPFWFRGKQTVAKPVVFGNIFQTDIKKIWFSKERKEFIKSQRLAQNLPSSCAACIDSMEMLCSKRTCFGR